MCISVNNWSVQYVLHSGGAALLQCFDLMAIIVENADSREHVDLNIVRTETASFLEAGYCESGTNLAQNLTVPTSFGFVFKIIACFCKSTVTSFIYDRFTLGKVDAATSVDSPSGTGSATNRNRDFRLHSSSY